MLPDRNRSGHPSQPPFTPSQDQGTCRRGGRGRFSIAAEGEGHEDRAVCALSGPPAGLPLRSTCSVAPSDFGITALETNRAGPRSRGLYGSRRPRSSSAAVRSGSSGAIAFPPPPRRSRAADRAATSPPGATRDPSLGAGPGAVRVGRRVIFGHGPLTGRYHSAVRPYLLRRG